MGFPPALVRRFRKILHKTRIAFNHRDKIKPAPFAGRRFWETGIGFFIR
jgi:hypothetical protein